MPLSTRPRADKRADFIAVYIIADDLRAGEIGTCFAAAGITAMAESAVLFKVSVAVFYHVLGKGGALRESQGTERQRKEEGSAEEVRHASKSSLQDSRRECD